MGKVGNYIIITIGLVLLLKIAGIPTGLDWIASFVGLSTTSSAVNTSSFIAAVIILLSVSVTGAIIIGTFSQTANDYVVKSGFGIATVLLFVSTFVGIMSYMSQFQSWLFYPVLLIMGVMSIDFIWSTVNWVFSGEQ